MRGDGGGGIGCGSVSHVTQPATQSGSLSRQVKPLRRYTCFHYAAHCASYIDSLYCWSTSQVADNRDDESGRRRDDMMMRRGPQEQPHLCWDKVLILTATLVNEWTIHSNKNAFNLRNTKLILCIFPTGLKQTWICWISLVNLPQVSGCHQKHIANSQNRQSPWNWGWKTTVALQLKCNYRWLMKLLMNYIHIYTLQHEIISRIAIN